MFRDLSLSRLRRGRKREPRQMKPFERAEPRESIPVDVKYVPIAGRWPQAAAGILQARETR